VLAVGGSPAGVECAGSAASGRLPWRAGWRGVSGARAGRRARRAICLPGGRLAVRPGRSGRRFLLFAPVRWRVPQSAEPWLAGIAEGPEQQHPVAGIDEEDAGRLTEHADQVSSPAALSGLALVVAGSGSGKTTRSLSAVGVLGTRKYGNAAKLPARPTIKKNRLMLFLLAQNPKFTFGASIRLLSNIDTSARPVDEVLPCPDSSTITLACMRVPRSARDDGGARYPIRLRGRRVQARPQGPAGRSLPPATRGSATTRTSPADHRAGALPR
jgi:hypothetical protein